MIRAYPLDPLEQEITLFLETGYVFSQRTGFRVASFSFFRDCHIIVVHVLGFVSKCMK